MTSDIDAEILAWVRLAKAGDVEGHDFHGNQYSGGIGGGGETGGGAPPRQADSGRNQVSADRYGSTPPATPEAPKTTQDIKPVVGEKHEPAPLPNHDTRIKSDPKDETPKGIKDWGREIHFALARGEQPIISAKHFSTLLADMARSGRQNNDITNLRVEGTRLMGLDGKGFARIKMPQVDESVRPKFVEDILKSDGIKVKELELDPLKLKPIQKEINGNKAGGIAGSNPDGIPAGMRILVTRDGFVLDGHHTWAAAVALALSGAAKTIPVYQLDCDWQKGMDVGLEWDRINGVKGQGFDAPPLKKSVWFQW
jgi:hypothetical protein